jgi:DNA invertase Pin-like site-specific DNA recombinase
MKAVAYVRVSTDEQKLGPEAQRAAILDWARREGVEVVAWCSDLGVSGGADLEARPALVEALAALRAHRAGVLVVAKRDRLARDVYVAATIERAAKATKARVVCADGAGNGEGPADEFMRTMLDGAAQYERALIRARTKSALAAKSARGERVGGIPFGMRLGADGKALEADPGEGAIVARVRELRAAGVSVRAIEDALALAGIRHPRTGGRIGKSQVARMAP